MFKFFQIMLVAIPSVFLLSGLSHADSSREAALGQLKELLPLVCGDFNNSGNSKSFAVKGDAEAKIDGFMKRLVDLGISGAADFKSDEYVGVLREEVGGQLTGVRQCRMKVYEDISNLINENSSATISNDGNKNSNIIGGGNSVNIK